MMSISGDQVPECDGCDDDDDDESVEESRRSH